MHTMLEALLIGFLGFEPPNLAELIPLVKETNERIEEIDPFLCEQVNFSIWVEDVPFYKRGKLEQLVKENVPEAQAEWCHYNPTIIPPNPDNGYHIQGVNAWDLPQLIFDLKEQGFKPVLKLRATLREQ